MVFHQIYEPHQFEIGELNNTSVLHPLIEIF